MTNLKDREWDLFIYIILGNLQYFTTTCMILYLLILMPVQLLGKILQQRDQLFPWQPARQPHRYQHPEYYQCLEDRENNKITFWVNQNTKLNETLYTLTLFSLLR